MTGAVGTGVPSLSTSTERAQLTAGAAESPATRARRARPRWWPYRGTAAAAVIGLAVTLTLTLLSHALYTRNEKRLLALRVREVGSVLAESQPSRQEPLASAAALADATAGSRQKFLRFMGPYVGAAPRPFTSVSLWRLSDLRRPLALAGAPPALRPYSPAGQAFFARAAKTAEMSVIGLGSPLYTHIGYAFTTPAMHGQFAAYGETPLPADRRSRLRRNTAFSELDYAIYLGPSARPRDLLLTSVNHPPLRGAQASIKVPFADTVLTLVVAPHQSLAGTLPQRLPLIIALVGALLTAGATALTLRLTRRQLAAEHLAQRLEGALSENQQLYAEQRTIAQTLQHALLPQELPLLTGAQAAARYEPAQRGVEIGGDWYDVIPVAGDRLLMVVGDISGHGLPAATTMASLRFAIHAYAAQGDPPTAILGKLARMLSVENTGQLATVLCALIDLRSREICLASAGHLPPLLLSEAGARYLETNTGVPIGVQPDATYTSTNTTAPPGATLLGFTDGLVERRGESIDAGLERLRRTASDDPVALSQLLDELIDRLLPDPPDDDAAIVAVRWTTSPPKS